MQRTAQQHSLTGPFTFLFAVSAAFVGAAGTAFVGTAGTWAADAPMRPLPERFAAADGEEVPDFQRHVVPLLGRLGCNGRACHGSFQGQGGFRLSLFGYDFKADHEALMFDQDEMRVDTANVNESLVLVKPTDEHEHEGGQRYEKGGWEHHVLRRWIESQAPFDEANQQKLVRLEVTPTELSFRKPGQTLQLQAVAVWPDGSREDVTPLCRFKSNDDLAAAISKDGLVTSGQAGATHVVAFYDNAVVPVPVVQPVSNLVGAKYPDVPTPTTIDRLVVQKLRQLGIVPSELATDAEFLRRVSLDITGTLPTPDEVQAFLSDRSANKRNRKIDELLERPAYAAWWTTRLCDITGNNEDALRNAHPLRGQASLDWYDWIFQRVEDNVPYDELVAGIVLAKSRRDGQSYADFAKEMSSLYRGDSDSKFADLEMMPHYWARRDFRQPEERAIGFAHAFMGVRIQCAQCHKHPFDQWSKTDFEEFSKFFTGVVAANAATDIEGKQQYEKIVKKLGLADLKGNNLRKELPAMLEAGRTIPFPEVVVRKPRFKAKKPTDKKNRKQPQPAALTASLLGGDQVDLTAHEDVREPLMQWLRDPDNRYFSRAFVNRVWSAYFNVGIVNPPDDLSLANPPSNGPLLDYLSKGFVENGFNMKWLHREIARSRTYQLSWRPNETNRRDETYFSRSVPRRMPAEVVYDAIAHATASDEHLAAVGSELDGRAIAIPGAGTRYGNARSGPGYALTLFGRSTRDSNCDCDRTMEPSLMQTVYLQNDQEMFAMLDRRKDGWLDQLTRQYGWKDSAAPQRAGAKRPANFKAKVRQLSDREQQLRAAGKTQQADQLAQSLRRFRQRFSNTDETAATTKKLDEQQTDTIVRDAYLRTLSRLPLEREKEISRQFIAQAENPREGIRGLMWALLNTKEFIVNH